MKWILCNYLILIYWKNKYIADVMLDISEWDKQDWYFKA